MNPNDIIPSLLPNLEFNDLFPTYQDLVQLTERISRIDVDLNMHDLRIELEKMKRRKLRASVNNIRKEILPDNNMVAQIQYDLSTLQERVGALDMLYNNEMARISSLTHRSLSRIHHLFVTVFPYLTMPPDSHFETAQLANELLQTIQQFHTHCNTQTFTNL